MGVGVNDFFFKDCYRFLESKKKYIKPNDFLKGQKTHLYICQNENPSLDNLSSLNGNTKLLICIALYRQWQFQSISYVKQYIWWSCWGFNLSFILEWKYFICRMCDTQMNIHFIEHDSSVLKDNSLNRFHPDRISPFNADLIWSCNVDSVIFVWFCLLDQ